MKFWFDVNRHDKISEAKLYPLLCDLVMLRNAVSSSKQTWRFTQIRNKFGVDRFKILMQILHKDLKISITILATEVGVNVKSLNAWLKMTGIKPNRAGQTQLKPSLFLNHNVPALQDHVFVVSDKLAYLMGFLTGDGHVSHRDGRIVAYNTEFSLKNIIYSMLAKYGSVTYSELERRGRKKLWRMDLGDCKLARLFTRKNISAILKHPKMSKHFIAGFYDAEGSAAQKVFGKDYTVSFTNINKALLILIRRALRSYNINSSDIKLMSEANREAKIVNDVFITRNDVFRFTISPSDFVQFVNMFASLSKHEHKRDSLIVAKQELVRRR